MDRRKDSTVQAEVAQRVDKISGKSWQRLGNGKLCRTYSEEKWEQSNRKPEIELKGVVSPLRHRPSW